MAHANVYLNRFPCGVSRYAALIFLFRDELCESRSVTRGWLCCRDNSVSDSLGGVCPFDGGEDVIILWLNFEPYLEFRPGCDSYCLVLLRINEELECARIGRG